MHVRSAHMYVSPSIGMEYAYVKCVHVGWNEDRLQSESRCRYVSSSNVSGLVGCLASRGNVEVQPRCWWRLRVEGCVALTAPCLSPSVPWRVIKTDDSDAVPSGSTVSTAQPFAPSFIPLPPPRSNSALITASSIHQCIDGHDRRCGTH